MVISAFHFPAGHTGHGAAGRPARPVAVWEPSGYREASAEERLVRTLELPDRTQGLPEVGGAEAAVSPGEERSARRREAVLTYLIGALFGLAVVGYSVIGGGEERGAEAEVPAPSVTQVPGR